MAEGRPKPCSIVPGVCAAAVHGRPRRPRRPRQPQPLCSVPVCTGSSSSTRSASASGLLPSCTAPAPSTSCRVPWGSGGEGGRLTQVCRHRFYFQPISWSSSHCPTQPQGWCVCLLIFSECSFSIVIVLYSLKITSGKPHKRQGAITCGVFSDAVRHVRR